MPVDEGKKKLREVEVAVEEEDLESIPVTEVELVREPLVHQVGRQALGFAMAIIAEKLANVTYDQMLKVYRSRKH